MKAYNTECWDLDMVEYYRDGIFVQTNLMMVAED